MHITSVETRTSRTTAGVPDVGQQQGDQDYQFLMKLPVDLLTLSTIRINQCFSCKDDSFHLATKISQISEKELHEFNWKLSGDPL